MVIITHATSATETSDTVPKNPFRRAVFTVYAQDKGVPMPLDWEFMKKKLTYFAYGDEICPTTQRPHHQCFAYAKTAMRFSGWVELINHIEENSYINIQEMKGSFKANEVYCSKEGELKEFGERPAQGKRTDLVEVKKLIDSGKRPMEIVDEHDEHIGTVARHEKFWNRYDQYKRQKKAQNDRTKPQVYIRWGPPGTGKTVHLDNEHGYDGWRFVPDNTGRWFDNCSDRDVVCFDDVKINEIPPITTILRLTHEYPCQVPVKGGFDTWKPRVIYFTSNYPPEQWWNLSYKDPNYEAFMRRVTNIQHLTEPYIREPDHGDQTQEN